MDRGGGTGEAMLWRLLRIGSAPYFVLGSSAERSLRLRIATSWDWRQQFQLVAIGWSRSAAASPESAGTRSCEIAPRRDARGDRPHRGALEPRTLRRASRGQGVSRHAPSPGAGLLRVAMKEFDLTALSPPLRVPRLTSGPGGAAARSPSGTWISCTWHRPIRRSPRSRRYRAPTASRREGPSSSARTSGPSTATASPSSSPTRRSRGTASGRSGCGCKRSRAAGPRWATGSSRRPGAGAGRARVAGPVRVRVREARHSPGAPVRRAVEHRFGPHGRVRRVPTRSDAPGLGADRRGAEGRRLLCPAAVGVGLRLSRLRETAPVFRRNHRGEDSWRCGSTTS